MQRETPAVTAVIRTHPGGVQKIYACAAHVKATIRQLGGGKNLEQRPADPSIHGCKGCWDDWPAD